MNWDAIAVVGQVLGSIAVFVTLVYLSMQTRQAKEATQRAISQGRSEAYRHQLAWATEPRMAAIMVKANMALGTKPDPFSAMLMEKAGLTREEAGSLLFFQVAAWNNRLQQIAATDGMNNSERRLLDAAIAATYGVEGVQRMYYDFMKPYAPPEAIRYVEEVLARRATPTA
jgi:hypothetical protein